MDKLASKKVRFSAICIVFWRGAIWGSSFKILLVRCFNLFPLLYTPSPLTPLSPPPPPLLIQINVYNRSVSPLPPALKINFGFKKLFFLSKKLNLSLKYLNILTGQTLVTQRMPLNKYEFLEDQLHCGFPFPNNCGYGSRN